MQSTQTGFPYRGELVRLYSNNRSFWPIFGKNTHKTEQDIGNTSGIYLIMVNKVTSRTAFITTTTLWTYVDRYIAHSLQMMNSIRVLPGVSMFLVTSMGQWRWGTRLWRSSHRGYRSNTWLWGCGTRLQGCCTWLRRCSTGLQRWSTGPRQCSSRLWWSSTQQWGTNAQLPGSCTQLRGSNTLLSWKVFITRQVALTAR